MSGTLSEMKTKKVNEILDLDFLTWFCVQLGTMSLCVYKLV